MHPGAITDRIDIAQVTLYAFWIFFAGLIFYLRSEDRREGFPLRSDVPPFRLLSRFPGIPRPKIFRLHNGEIRMAPRAEPLEQLTTARPVGRWAGAPLVPIGDPMLAAVGPGSYANRPDVPDSIFDSGLPKTVPLRADPTFSLAKEDPDPRGMPVIAADGRVAGIVSDVWVDRAEVIVRFYEVTLPESDRRVLVPMAAANVDGGRRRVVVDAILAAQFATAPVIKHPEQVTFLEEDMISAYFAAGRLYATEARQEPFL
jgi:photosynthetic reaction center H subunit